MPVPVFSLSPLFSEGDFVMTGNIKPGTRLYACASLVQNGAVLCDVGTDHAYLPIYLCKKGIAVRAVASDIKEGPLARAGEHIKMHGLSDKISTRLTPGLSGMESEGFTDIVIAGMGGFMIRDIIAAAPFVCDSGVALILQPMKNADALRLYLAENGFEITHERLSSDDGKIYQIMRAVYDGKKRGFDTAALLLGEKNIAARAENRALFSMLCDKYLCMYEKKVRGAQAGSAEYESAKRVFDEISALAKE